MNSVQLFINIVIVFCVVDSSETAVDFSQNCNQLPQTYYSDGVCYQLQSAALVTSATASTTCAANGAQMATIRSADVAEGFINLLKGAYSAYQAGVDYIFWIGVPNNQPSTYLQLQSSKSSDAIYTLQVSVTNSTCVAFVWNTISPNLLTINDQDSFCSQPCCWFFCETVPTFQQVGCNQTLTRNSGVVANTTNASSIDDCAEACAQFVWCAGVNYDTKNQTCEILTENTQTQSLTCVDSQDWLYYERKT